MVDKETIETKVVDTKEKIETKAEERHAKAEETKEKVKAKAEETIDATKEKTKEKIGETKDKTKETLGATKEKTKETIDATKTKVEETKEEVKQIKDTVEKDFTEGVGLFRENVKTIQSIIDEKINDYKEASVQNINAEVLETEECYYIRVALPGIDKDEIEIDASENEISIEASFKPLSDDIEECTVLLNEMKIGRCSKNIFFSETIDLENIKAKYGLGIVDLTVPKVEKPSKKITIE